MYYSSEGFNYLVIIYFLKKLRWARHVAGIRGGMSALKILTSKSTGKRSLGRPRHRWEKNIRTDLTEIRCQYEELS